MEDRRQNIPAVGGVPRFWVVGEWVGNFRLDNDNSVHLSSGSPGNLRTKYENVRLEQVMTELADLLKH